MQDIPEVENFDPFSVTAEMPGVTETCGWNLVKGIKGKG